MANTNETKRVPTIRAEVVDTGALNLTFSNGRIIRLHPAELTTELQRIATLHGLKQKLVDAAAISRNPETGRSATVDDKYDAVYAVYQRLISGQWNEPREGGGNQGGLLFKALCRMYADKTPEQLREWLEKKSDKEKAALRANPKVAAVIAEIQAEAGKDVNTDELLNELG
jgi:hypothetical protein